MNKFLKTIIAILGATNLVFSMFIPIILAILVIDVSNLSKLNSIILVAVAIVSSLYRAVEIWIN